MTSIWGELKRRNVVKVAIAYAIVGWLLIEVSSVLLPAFEAPDWVLRVIVLLVGIGFVLALVLSWAYELTPEGVKKSHEVEATESIAQVTGRKIDFAIIGALVLALGFVVNNYVLDDDSGEISVLSNSVAVLPFENLSLDPEEAFFATGIHEEVLNQLAKLSELNVIARTSMMQYADGGKSIPQVAEELNVETVMEGSVRYADGRVLVTAQLINPETNAHLWSDSYNREFADVFAIQADIAMNIANALEAEFSLEEQEILERQPTDSSEAYSLFLRASQAYAATSSWGLAVEYLDQALELDPNYAEAYAHRAQRAVVLLSTNAGPEELYEISPAVREGQALQDIETALRLDPDSDAAYSALGLMHQYNWRGAEAREAYARALELSPNDPNILRSQANFNIFTGNRTEAVRQARRAVQLDSRNSDTFVGLGEVLDFAGEPEEARTAYQQALELNPSSVVAGTHLALNSIILGDDAAGRSQIRIAEAVATDFSGPPLLAQVILGYSMLGLEEDAARLLNQLHEMEDDRPIQAATWATAYLSRDNQEALAWLGRAAENRPYEAHILTLRLKYNTFQEPTLDEPAFVALREKLGFTDL